MNKILLTLAATTLLAASPVIAKEQPKGKPLVTSKTTQKKAKLKNKHAVTNKVIIKKDTSPDKHSVINKTNKRKKASWGFTPYLGAEAQWRHMDFEPNFGNNLFKHDYPQGNVYAGIRFNKFISIEAGYENSLRKKRTNLMHQGDMSAGVVLNVPTQYSSSAEIKGPHINFVFSTPRNEYCMRFIGLVGMAQLKAKLVRNTEFVYLGGIQLDPNLLGIATTSTFEKKKNILRLGAGIEHMVDSNWGIRTSLIWENTNRFNIRATETPFNETSEVHINNNLIYSIGTFINF